MFIGQVHVLGVAMRVSLSLSIVPVALTPLAGVLYSWRLGFDVRRILALQAQVSCVD